MDEPEIWRWVWLGATAMFAIAELTSAPGTFFLLSFAIGALVACIASFVGVPVVVGWALFLVASGAALALLVPIGRRMDRTREGQLTEGANRLIGRQAVVLHGIPAGPHEMGMVRVEREEWRAEHLDGTEVPEGAIVDVIRVDGTRLVVRSRWEPTPPET